MVNIFKKPWWWYGITIIVVFLLSDFVFIIIGFFVVEEAPLDLVVAAVETFLRFLIWWIVRNVLGDLYIKKEFAVKGEM